MWRISNNKNKIVIDFNEIKNKINKISTYDFKNKNKIMY